MSSAKTHWDPIQGTIEITTPDTSNIRSGLPVPPLLRRVLLIAALLSILWVMIAGFIKGDFPFVAVGATTVIWALFLACEHLQNEDGRKTVRRVKLAKANGWSYTGELMARVREFRTAWKSDGAERETRLVKSERALAVEAKVPELTVTRFGGFIGALFDGEFWGKSSRDDQPFWLAIGSMGMEAGLALDGNLRKDAFGGKGGAGQFFSLLGAYRIGRKTSVRAVIMPENLFNKGPLDRDIKTESVRFNAAFNVSGRYKDPARQDSDATLDVLRILSPATQDAMLSMAERYHNIGFVLDDDVLYFMAQDKLVGKNAAPEAIDKLLFEIAANFEAAKFAIKRYVE
ncbi:hypothetical protein [Hoeflea sp.]|uniref:hypothetical protein n=1 Tax=Hoeflea sp. TaxID=1940281 RepID=UPI003BAFDAEA